MDKVFVLALPGLLIVAVFAVPAVRRRLRHREIARYETAAALRAAKQEEIKRRTFRWEADGNETWP